jgi:ERCC4-type nuclease
MMPIGLNLSRAKEIAHETRRKARTEEFRPHDEVIMKQIPGVDQQAAEAARQEIRSRYAALQVQMNAAQTPEELKALVPEVSID